MAQNTKNPPNVLMLTQLDDTPMPEPIMMRGVQGVIEVEERIKVVYGPLTGVVGRVERVLSRSKELEVLTDDGKRIVVRRLHVERAQ